MKNEWKSPAAGATLIILLTLAAYLPALRCGYIWDDDVYVTRNPLLTAPDGLRRIWFTAHPYTAYFPMVNTTLRFEHRLWGLNPAGYHFVNILLHATNALLVWVVLRKLAVPGSWLAAAIWAVHPVNVESVAWITELKNTQSTLFYLLTLLAWMKFTDEKTVRPWRWYALALLLYGPALFSKTTASTLPAAMLLVLWLRKQPIGWRRFLQIVSFFCYGVGIGLLSMWCEAHSGNYGEALRYSYGAVGRLLIATHALWFYAAKLAWPTQLTFIYPRWEINPHDPRQYIWLIGCVAVALLLWWRRQAIGRGPVAAVVFFGAALSPLLGFIPVYTFRYSFVANHYEYVASIGLIALFAGAVSSHADAWQLGHTMRRTLSGALLLMLGALTWQLARTYQDPETLWRDTIAKDPQGWLGHTNLAEELFRQGRVAEATAESTTAFRLKPDIPETNCNLGSALLAAGKVDEAISHFEEAVRLQPRFTQAYISWGVALVKMGKPDDAIRHYEKALRINPEDTEAHDDLGNALLQMGKVPEAIEHYQLALRTDPDYVGAHVNLGTALLRTGKVQWAVGEYEQALRINPDYAEAHSNLGAIYQRMNKLPEAVAQYEQALRIKPDYVEAHFNLGLALEKLGRMPEAIEHYQQAVKLQPDFLPATRALARLQAGQ
jgi:tetratricopeptide (TPR) repeat protein